MKEIPESTRSEIVDFLHAVSAWSEPVALPRVALNSRPHIAAVRLRLACDAAVRLLSGIPGQRGRWPSKDKPRRSFDRAGWNLAEHRTLGDDCRAIRLELDSWAGALYRIGGKRPARFLWRVRDEFRSLVLHLEDDLWLAARGTETTTATLDAVYAPAR